MAGSLLNTSEKNNSNTNTRNVQSNSNKTAHQLADEEKTLLLELEEELCLSSENQSMLKSYKDVVELGKKQRKQKDDEISDGLQRIQKLVNAMPETLDEQIEYLRKSFNEQLAILNSKVSTITFNKPKIFCPGEREPDYEYYRISKNDVVKNDSEAMGVAED